MTDIRVLLKDMRAVQRQIGEAVQEARLDPAKRMAVVALRRRANEAVLRVSAQVDVEPLFLENPGLSIEFRRRFSELRSKVAIFQAKWPAVLLSQQNEDFDKGSAELRACNRAFDEWILKTLHIQI